MGALATLADLVLLWVLVKSFGLSPQTANLPSLIVGSLIQFMGHRHFVFRASEGHVVKQAAGFLAIEAGGFLCNAVGYYFIVQLMPQQFVLARIICTTCVFLAFSYPLWRFWFKRSLKTTLARQ